jgi:peptide/nickel transport system ATP-binding protein
MDAESGQRLQYIEGAPPDLIRLPKGCPFTPRCPYRTERCLSEHPALAEIEPRHTAACLNLDAIHVRAG